MEWWTSCDPAEVYDALAVLSAKRPAWQADGACLEHPELTWFPGRGEDSEPAKVVCRGCLVRAECLAYALADRDLLGVWGATSDAQRKAMRKAARAA